MCFMDDHRIVLLMMRFIAWLLWQSIMQAYAVFVSSLEQTKFSEV